MWNVLMKGMESLSTKAKGTLHSNRCLNKPWKCNSVTITSNERNAITNVRNTEWQYVGFWCLLNLNFHISSYTTPQVDKLIHYISLRRESASYLVQTCVQIVQQRCSKEGGKPLTKDSVEFITCMLALPISTSTASVICRDTPPANATQSDYPNHCRVNLWDT